MNVALSVAGFSNLSSGLKFAAVHVVGPVPEMHVAVVIERSQTFPCKRQVMVYC